ncbi:MAG: substrate-binding domain-containing protein, partial [Anaerolineales bacterium]
MRTSVVATRSGSPAAYPPPAPEPVRLAVTDLAAPLAADLVAAYRQVGDAPVVSVIPLAALADELQTGRADVALTANPAPEQCATPIASVSFAVIVHPDNPIARLSLAQVRALLAGQITDWAQVG